MRRLPFIVSIIVVIGLLLMPAMIRAQSDQAATNPPIAQPLVREGDFAIRLAEALNLGTAASETEAESMAWLCRYCTPEWVDCRLSRYTRYNRRVTQFCD